MPRLSLATKKSILQALREGKSINWICRNIHKTKGTVYYYYVKVHGRIPLTAPAFISDDSELEGEVLGIFAGDGSFSYTKTGGYYGTISVGAVNYDYALYAQEVFSKFFGKIFRIKKSGPTVFTLKLSWKSLYDYFHQQLHFDNTYKAHTVYLRTTVHSREFKIGFLRSLMDTDGTIYQEGKCLRVRFHTSSHELKDNICLFLEQLGFDYRINLREPGEDKRKNFHFRIALRTVKDCWSFVQLIKPYKSRRIKEWDR